MNVFRSDFPTLSQQVNGKSLVYLDSAATTQKPQAVIDTVSTYYTDDNANVHRGLHQLSERATQQYEGVREKVVKLINAQRKEEIIFTGGTTDAINLVATSYGQSLKKGDEIIITTMEHHSNIVPWQLLCERTGAILKIVPLTDTQELDMVAYERLFSEKTRLVSFIHVSNVLGVINPIADMVAIAKRNGAKTLIDGAQSIAHMPVDVQSLDCDFYVFSSHKMYGPTGVGVLYGKYDVLDAMPPYQGGGEMIRQVTFENSSYNALPHKFEAGTPNIAGVIGFGKAIDYLQAKDKQQLMRDEADLFAYAEQALSTLPQVSILAKDAKHRTSVISFTVEDIHPHDLGTILDTDGVAIRAGHHCAMPLMDYLGLSSTARISFAIYNTKEDVDRVVEALKKAIEMFA